MKLRSTPIGQAKVNRPNTSSAQSSSGSSESSDRAAHWDGRPVRSGLKEPEERRLTPKELAKRAIATAMLGMALLTPLQSKRHPLWVPAPPPPKSGTLTPGTHDPLQPAPGPDQGLVPELEDIELVPHGVSQRAIDEAVAVINALKVEPRFQRPFRKAKIQVVIIPAGTALTALPEFASLRGKLTFDGRPWEDVRGAGGHACHKDKICVAVPEENLARLSSDPYGANSIAMHELTHAVFDHVVGKDVKRRVQALFAVRTAGGRPFVSTYAASNPQEYWAESTNAYFSRHTARDVAWLAANDPQMVAILNEVYGPPIATPAHPDP